MKNLFIIISFFLIASCGDPPKPKISLSPQISSNPRDRSFTFTFKFNDNDPQILAKALEQGTKELRKDHQPALNQILDKMGLSIELEELALKDKPLWVLIKDGVSKVDPNAYQTIDIQGMVKLVYEGGWSSRGSHTFLHRKLIGPSVEQNKIIKLQTLHNDLILPEPSDRSSLTTWKIQTSYRQLLQSVFRWDAAAFIYKETEMGKALSDKLSNTVKTEALAKGYGQEVSSSVKNFVEAHFKDLREIHDIVCSTWKTEKKDPNAPEWLIKTTKHLLDLKFTIGDAPIRLAKELGNWEPFFVFVFHDIVEQLLLTKFDRLFS